MNYKMLSLIGVLAAAGCGKDTDFPDYSDTAPSITVSEPSADEKLIQSVAAAENLHKQWKADVVASTNVAPTWYGVLTQAHALRNTEAADRAAFNFVAASDTSPAQRYSAATNALAFLDSMGTSVQWRYHDDIHQMAGSAAEKLRGSGLSGDRLSFHSLTALAEAAKSGDQGVMNQANWTLAQAHRFPSAAKDYSHALSQLSAADQSLATSSLSNYLTNLEKNKHYIRTARDARKIYFVERK